ncbi:MAG: sigma-70 family RNA polymerase sigma factor [Acidobacteriota bacterium]
MNNQKAKPQGSKGGKTAPGTPGGRELSALVRGAQRGDIDDFQKLYDVFSRKILNYLYRMTGSREEAEDLAQDTFVLAFRKLDTLKEPAKIQSWLFRIAQNNVYQRYRGKRPQLESIDREEASELSDLQKLATPQPSPEGSVLSEELERVIAETIAELPEKYRTVFILSAVQRLSYQEISEIVDRSLASVKSDIHRARVTVRDRIKQYLGENYGMSKLH